MSIMELIMGNTALDEPGSTEKLRRPSSVKCEAIEFAKRIAAWD